MIIQHFWPFFKPLDPDSGSGSRRPPESGSGSETLVSSQSLSILLVNAFKLYPTNLVGCDQERRVDVISQCCRIYATTDRIPQAEYLGTWSNWVNYHKGAPDSRMWLPDNRPETGYQKRLDFLQNLLRAWFKQRIETWSKKQARDVCSSMIAHLAAVAATRIRFPASCQILYIK